jgi:hypothetical protein
MIYANSGYHDCPCSDCFEIAIGVYPDGTPALCSICEGVCNNETECQVEYEFDDGGDIEEPTQD